MNRLYNSRMACNLLLRCMLMITWGFIICACTRLSSDNNNEQQPPLLAFNDSVSAKMAFEILNQAKPLMYADRYAIVATNLSAKLLWLSTEGLRPQADTLMSFLRKINDEGLDPDAAFNVNFIEARIDSINSWIKPGATYTLSDTCAAQLDAALTKALIRYAYGQRYGYTLPHKILNNLLVDIDVADKSKTVYRCLFDINCDKPSDSLAHVALDCARNGGLNNFLLSIQPQSPIHKAFSQDFKRARVCGDSARIQLARINLERSRWRYQRPDTGKFIFVNLAPQMLTAVDTKRDSCLTMKVCCGNRSHKSPLLSSRINCMEFNPYWVVPQTIIRNEIAASHVNDSAYFARNNMVAINKSTNETVDPTSLTADQWRSAAYTLRQEKGKGNSLGRIIFRFPNNFAVYLHDTNQPGMFALENRAVSHGCIRVQKPFDLATFLLNPDTKPSYIDRMRITIDLPPLTQEGRLMKERQVHSLTHHNFSQPIPLLIDYYTLYPDINGNLVSSADPYGYDKVIFQALQPLF